MKQLLALSLLALGACTASHSEPAAEAPGPYRATAVGRIDSAGEARQLVAAADGVIERVLVRRGDRVRAGQVLLEVGCAPRAGMAQASLAAARQSQAEAALVRAGPRPEALAQGRAALAKAEADLRNAEQLLERAQALAGRGFVSRRELDARSAERDAARAARDGAAAQLAALSNGSRPQELASAQAAAQAAQGESAAARAALAQCQVRSPIDGQVLQVLRREGEFSGASQGAPLIVVGDLDQRIVRAEVGERDVPHLRIGSPVEVWIDGSPKRWRGRVVEMASVMGRRSARSLDPTDRFDRDVREAIVVIDDPDLPSVVGLRVTVGFVR
ncbi:MAG TPA: HlyD family efflux transporter periplasmic adaptor subunit [Novosphingobium sp.]|nr:HlyD family efflux transporter periplasmic adaptor subunit [Novosphingobium sp.]